MFDLVDGDQQAAGRYQFTRERGFRPLKLVVREKLGRPFRMTLDVEYDATDPLATSCSTTSTGTRIGSATSAATSSF